MFLFSFEKQPINIGSHTVRLFRDGAGGVVVDMRLLLVETLEHRMW